MAVGLARWIYAGLTYWRTRCHMKQLAAWKSGIDNTTSRHFRICRRIWISLRAVCAREQAFSIRLLMDYFYHTPAAHAASKQNEVVPHGELPIIIVA
jgi:hypothetical protein